MTPSPSTRCLFRYRDEDAIRAALQVFLETSQDESTSPRPFEVYSPYPLEFAIEAKARENAMKKPPQNSALACRSQASASDSQYDLKPKPLARFALIGGITGGLSGYALQYFTEVMQFPRMIADRPQHSWPAFMPVTFEMTILGAALSIFYGFFFLTKLPRLNHPVFEAPQFDRASQDQFFLEILTKKDDAIIEEIKQRTEPVEVSFVDLD